MSEKQSNQILTIIDRPFITVTRGDYGDVTIAVTRMDQLETIVTEEVTIPADCVLDIATALQKNT